MSAGQDDAERARLVRAVLSAALDAAPGIASLTAFGESESIRRFLDTVDDLRLALDAEPNKPHGFVLRWPWGEIPAGWFVKTPDGAWWEVTSTRRDGARQIVQLRHSETGRGGEWPRDPYAKVAVRKGTKTKDVDVALDTLRAMLGRVEVLEGVIGDQIS